MVWIKCWSGSVGRGVRVLDGGVFVVCRVLEGEEKMVFVVLWD